MENEVATLEGFSMLEKLFDKEMLTEMLMAGAGGALGATVFEMGLANVDWFKTGSKNAQTLKEVGAALVLAVAGGAALWQRVPDVARGHVGVMFGKIAEAGLRHIGQLPARSYASAPAAATTQGVNQIGDVRVRTPELPPGGPFSGRVTVRPANPAAMANISAYGNY